ncbi:MAG: flagellar hook-associated protein FlgL [Deltaproteobacteria bacterium]|nr:flagellar hook-associated protein FlgL [Deltaproteobacteria bacterium]
MRVTEKMLFNTGQVQTAAARERLEKAMVEVSSGKRITHAADDPAGSGIIITSKISQQRYEAIQQAVGRSADELNTAEGVLGEVSNVMQRGRELAMQLGSAQFSGPDRATSANEVDGLFNTVIGLMNTEVGGRYIFGGTQDDAPPFQADGTYVGDAGIRQVEIAPGVLEPVSLRADIALKGVGGGVDVTQVLRDFAIALRNNDVVGVQNALDGFDKSLNQVSGARKDAGASLNILQTSDQVSRLSRDQMKIQVANVAETDLPEAASKMALANTALEAALAATASSFKMSLIDKL